jgi:hypothetical protein
MEKNKEILIKIKICTAFWIDLRNNTVSLLLIFHSLLRPNNPILRVFVQFQGQVFRAANYTAFGTERIIVIGCRPFDLVIAWNLEYLKLDGDVCLGFEIFSLVFGELNYA